jgi:sugar/nucleoside kinase (ribokinase family)
MILVAGHLCLDVIPRIQSYSELKPGVLARSWSGDFFDGRGPVSNVGISLHKLGANVRLVGKVGKDAFGEIVLSILREYGLADTILVDENGDTSYSVVISPPGQDRMFLHCPGCNDTFVSSDVSHSAFEGIHHMHFGYPPLMAKMSENVGEELFDLFSRAKKHGLTTSLDMSLPDPLSKQGQVPWRQLLERVLPLVDYFLPSEDELAFMLNEHSIEKLAQICLDLGAHYVVIKRGERGLYAVSDGITFEQPCLPVKVVGTTGSGDATIAGLLFGLSKSWPIKNACFQPAQSVLVVSKMLTRLAV